jgi:hypothetical protein
MFPPLLFKKEFNREIIFESKIMEFDGKIDPKTTLNDIDDRQTTFSN